MPRNYKNYSFETLRKCLASIENKEITQRKASEKYGIPRRTIINQLRLLRSKMPSRPPGALVVSGFSSEEEALFVDCILRLSEYGFPLTNFDLRIVIRTYLEKIGRRVTKFKNNCPEFEAKKLEWTTNGTTRVRRRKLHITPGKSVIEELSILLDDKENEALAQPSTSKLTCRRRASSESSYAESIDMSVHDSSDLGSLGDLENIEANTDTAAETCNENCNFKPMVKAVGQYVVFTYEEEFFPGKITKITKEGPYISSMKRSLKSWTWPKPVDEIQYNWQDILGCIEVPKKIITRREI
ncbi:unnamed protein product [Parnassius apollo]|uniref:(apollo) hypothetical protein n=1 Tax=Parnassius apollo TaxID=110799 RepID=A0A8S3XFB2_PARAO|nr:unnamed protein product [Parnassius apollo]